MPDSESFTFESSSDIRALDDDRQMLVDIEHNIANFEKSIRCKTDDDWPVAVTSSEEKSTFFKRENSISNPEIVKKNKKYVDACRLTCVENLKTLFNFGKYLFKGHRE